MAPGGRNVTPKEFAFWFELIEHTATNFYKRGRRDELQEKDEPEQPFTLSAANKLLIKTNFEKLTRRKR